MTQPISKATASPSPSMFTQFTNGASKCAKAVQEYAKRFFDTCARGLQAGWKNAKLYTERACTCIKVQASQIARYAQHNPKSFWGAVVGGALALIVGGSLYLGCCTDDKAKKPEKGNE